MSIWNEKALGDFCSEVTVGFVGTQSKYFVASGIPLIRGQNVKEYEIELSDPKYIPQDIHEKWKKSKLAGGDIVIVRVGYPGTAAVIPEGFGSCNCASVVIVRTDKTQLNPYFATYFINSPKGKAIVSGMLVGSAQQVFNATAAKTLKLPVPPIVTQNKVVEVLDSYTSLIKNNNRRIAILEDMAQSLYREWFVHFRYPSHQDNLDADGKPKLIDSPLGQIPEGWEVKEFSKSIDFWNGKKCVSSESGEFDLYGANGIIGKAEGWKYENAVIIGRVGAYCGAVEYCFDRFWGSDNTIIAKCKSEKNISYLFSLLEHFNLNKFAGGSAQPLLTQTTLKQLKYIAPPENLVEQFELMVHKLFESVVNLKKRNKNLKQQRDMLLPKLISGQIEL